MKRTNEEWLEALREEGEPREIALAELRTLLLRGLRHAMAGRKIDDSLLEDALQETLLKILKQLDSFRGESRFVTWSMTIAARTVWTELRRRHWKNVSLDELLSDTNDKTHEMWSTGSGADRDLEQSRLASRVQAAIDTELTDKQRTALRAELAGMPQEEIARRMGSNRNALYKLVHDARKRLKKSLEADGYSIQDIASAFD